MKKNRGKRLLSLLLSILLVFGLMPTAAIAAAENAFILVAEGGGKLIITPEYVTYTEGQTVQEALAASGHEFTGLEDGVITAIDGVVGNFTRSDEDGGYDLTQPASEVEYFRFSEAADSKPSDGLRQLMTAMADYRQKDADVQAAAKTAYDTACKQFVGIDSNSAKVLAEDLNKAVSDYENTLNSTKYNVTFKPSAGSYSGATITAENAYGKVWNDDDSNGVLQLPAGTYTFSVEQDGLWVQGSVTVSGTATVTADLPKELWLKQDAFRLSGSYNAKNEEDGTFSDGEFTLGAWNDRQTTVAVSDQFIGSVYSYAEYDTAKLSEVPTLTAIYTSAETGEQVEKPLSFESLTSGVSNVLKRGAAGNAVIYRVSAVGSDGYTYAQDYTVNFARIPSLTAIKVEDQNGVDQAATMPFDGTQTSYTYKVLDSVTAVTVSATPLDDSYSVTVNGEDAKSGVEVSLNGETTVEVVVSGGGYTNTYTLTIQPGTGRNLNFLTTSGDVTVEVVNSNGVVMPYVKYKNGSNGNRYQYTLVPGEQYSYVATVGTYYHMADEFKLEEVANNTINVDLTKDDWLSELAFGTKQSATYKNTLTLDSAFASSDHNYAVTYVDTEHNAYIWVNTEEADVKIEAIYDQIFSSDLYHGKEQIKTLTAGEKKGTQLNRFLMDENPIENTVTIRLSKMVDGVNYYQDYEVDFQRSLTLDNITAKCDGAAATLIQQPDGTQNFASDVKEYSVTVSMAAQLLELDIIRYTKNTCYGEEEVGYRVLVDGVDVTETGTAGIALDGSIETQDVTIRVENDKAPNGATDYILHILKSPPVAATFAVEPAGALLNIHETMSGERLWPDETGAYQFCEGYSYAYALTEYGYVGKSGTLNVTRDENETLVVTDGSDSYTVTETAEGGGAVTIDWALQAAPSNSTIDTTLTAEWKNFRGTDSNNGVTNAQIPTAAEDGTLYWANQIGSGIDADAVGSPIIVDGDLITYASNKIYRIDTVSGEIKATGTMDHKSSFSITPPTYAEGMVFVALSNGTVQAFNAKTLESLWIYADKLGGQPNSPLTVKDGYLYTGFWNSETGDANFVCLSITDEDPGQTKESKSASWYHTSKGGYYWAGAYASDDFVLVGTDDGTNTCTGKSSSLLLFDAETGKLLDRLDNLNGDIRSTIVYDETTNAYYFTSKGGSFYSVQVKQGEDGWVLNNLWSVALQNGSNGTPMSTSSPVVYNGRAYVGVSGAGQFSNYSGHNITVINLSGKKIAYSVATQGYPQTSGLLTTAYEAERGYVYVYFFDNATPGKLRVLRDKAGQTKADYVTAESSSSTAYALFTPTGDQAQYAICSPITDEYGTIYFKNDSAHLMAFGSAIKKLEITTMPNKTSYKEGEVFNPTGMVVTATYANGKTRDVTDYVSWYDQPLTEQDAKFTISFEHVMYHNVEDGTAMTAGVKTTTPTVTLELTFDGKLVLGDANGDGEVTEADAQLILEYEAQTTEAAVTLDAADVSGDGKVDSNDAVLIAQYVADKITEFPVAETTPAE